MVIRFVRRMLVAAGLLLTACSVQVVSPYNPEIARGLVGLNISILTTATEVARNAQNPQTRARASFEHFASRYDDWLAQVETMRILSDLGNPGALDCAAVAARVGSILPSTDKADLERTDGGRAIDCQTLLLDRLKQRIERLAEYHKQFCAPTNPNILADCAGGFGARVGAIHVNGSDEALAVQPTLRAIRLLMRIQAMKKSTNS